MNTACIVLAAGAGTRMKSKKPKVAHEILGKPLVNWVLDSAKDAGIDQIISVVGHQSELVIPLIENDSVIAVQRKQLGTADAVKEALSCDELNSFDGTIVVLSGDCPLITSSTIDALVKAQQSSGAAGVVLAMQIDDPFGYGRIVKDETKFIESDGLSLFGVERIVEQKDANEDEAKINICNSGFYAFDASSLRDAIEKVGSNNAQNEFYLTDVLEIMKNAGKLCVSFVSNDPAECLGVNSRIQLAGASAILQRRINTSHMLSGVTMISPDLVWIGPDVKIESDVVINPNVMLMGNTFVGEDSIIGPNTRLTDTKVGKSCKIDETVAIEAIIDDNASCGPRAYLRPGAHLCEGAKAGTHVEIKKSVIGPNSKVPHLSYIGDTTIGSDVNIGAGSITCNYDGKNKHKTVIGDNTFIGSDTMMVAPVEIGSDVVVGAGSVITKDVPDGSLAVARSRERLIENWTQKHDK